eukprot:COSAG04_NODE_358_length_16025_cov_193.915610_4_plen_119_part_00
MIERAKCKCSPQCIDCAQQRLFSHSTPQGAPVPSRSSPSSPPLLAPSAAGASSSSSSPLLSVTLALCVCGVDCKMPTPCHVNNQDASERVDLNPCAPEEPAAPPCTRPAAYTHTLHAH